MLGAQLFTGMNDERLIFEGIRHAYLKHRSACGSGYPKLATLLTPYLATNSDFLQISFQGQFGDAEHENGRHFNFQGHLKGQIQSQRMEHRILSLNYVSTWTKMVSSGSVPPWVVRTKTLTWHLTFKDKIKVKDGVTDIIPTLRQHGYQDGLKR